MNPVIVSSIESCPFGRVPIAISYEFESDSIGSRKKPTRMLDAARASNRKSNSAAGTRASENVVNRPPLAGATRTTSRLRDSGPCKFDMPPGDWYVPSAEWYAIDLQKSTRKVCDMSDQSVYFSEQNECITKPRRINIVYSTLERKIRIRSKMTCAATVFEAVRLTPLQ